METCLGWFGWTPAAFWAATPAECRAALDGLLARQGKRHRRPDVAGLRRLIAGAPATSRSIKKSSPGEGPPGESPTS